MRIAMPSDDQVHLANHAGRAREFVVFDVDEEKVEKVEARPNPRATLHHAHAGHQHEHNHDHNHNHNHDDFYSILRDCEAVVALGMGPRLQNDLGSRGIAVYFTRDLDLHRVANAMASGLMEDQRGGNACDRTASRS